MLTGGIDLGGTKIESRLFDADWQTVESRRVATPQTNYADLVGALAGQIAWLEQMSGDAALPVGIGSPGIVDQQTGAILTANLPATGRTLPADIAARAGRPVPWLKDCTAFVLSEAQLGAGRGHRGVMGLILGTGVSGAFVRDGATLDGHADLAGEYGHMPLPATLVAAHDLPLIQCGCGRTGCYETYCAGPGLARLAEIRLGRAMTPAKIAAAAEAGDPAVGEVLSLWARIVGELLGTLMRALDPDCVVLGGGLTNMPGAVGRIAEGAAPTLLPGTRLPRIVLAEDGDSSGARGAALAARMAAEARV